MSPSTSRPRRRDLDESDVRVRPNRRGSRPRTKDRPAHADADAGWVLRLDRGRYTVLINGPDGDREVTAMKARELGRAGVVVGDRVGVVGDVTGRDGSLARIVRVEPRATVLRRSADDSDPVERIIVANAEQLGIVTALADPEPRARMIDRCLVAAYDAGMEPLLLLTKADLADAQDFLAGYAPFGLRAVAVGRDPQSGQLSAAGRQDVLAELGNRVTVLIGHSGVGKSTLVNAIVPGADRAVGRVNDVTGRGRHTSTSVVTLALPGGGWVIDTPGVRSFGLAHVQPDRIVASFPDLAPGLADCPRGCTHDEPECGLDPFVASGGAGPNGAERLDSLRRLLRSRLGQDDPGAESDSQPPDDE